jgi:aminotransferase EvaB
MKVWDYRSEYEREKKEILSAIEEVLDSGQLILGDKVKEFESSYANFCEVNYGVGVDNGTNAVFLALKALGIGDGDEVITVSNTAVPTVSAIVSCNAKPVFVDVNDSDFLMDTTKIESVITAKTKCILPVHLFGQCVDMDEINRIAIKHDLKVLEDCAQSHGAVYKGKKAGSCSDIAATSFYPTKILGTYGDAGLVMTSNEDLYKKLLRLRYYGMEKTYYSVEHGYNCRLDEIHAAILLRKLIHLDDYILKRQDIAKRYNELLKDSGLILPTQVPYGSHSYYLYVVRHPKRDIIMDELKKHDIFLNISYPWPIHTMDAYKYLGYKEGDLPVTEKIAHELFSLPMYPSLTEEKQLFVCDAVISVLKKNNLLNKSQ